MTHTYKISGMTCGGCQAKVQRLLSRVPGISKVTIELNKGLAEIQMDHHIQTSDLQEALRDYPNYQLSDHDSEQFHHSIAVDSEEKKSWWLTYKPVLLIFAYILVATGLIEFAVMDSFVWTRLLENFMAGFFLVFSFFKLLDLKGFADSYSTYDIVARNWKGWGYVYVFIELALGLAFLTGFNPFLTNAITLVVMTISIIGVLQSVLNKRKIKCACLGTVFNLPMSTITIIEDALMILMSGIMIGHFIGS
jgi:copper chaperone CopZ